MLFPMLTGAYYYAYEARPHGIVLGFCGLALVCWQKASEDGGKRMALLGLSVALLGACLMHCFAVLLVTPFVCVEVFRAFRQRRMDWLLWVALIAPLFIALAVYLPLLHSYHSLMVVTSFGHVAVAGWSQVGHFYDSLLGPSIIVVLAALVLFGLSSYAGAAARVASIVSDDLLLGLAFLLLPVWGVVLCKLVHGPYFHRYFFAAVAGVAIVLATGAACRGAGSRSGLALAMTLALGVLLSVSRVSMARLHGRGEALMEPSSRAMLNTTPGVPLAMHPLLEADRSKLPIAVLNPFDYIYLGYYAPALRERLYYVAIVPQEFTYACLRRFVECCVGTWNQPVLADEFAKTRERYLVYGDGRTPDQFIAMAQPGSYIESDRFQDGHFLLRVSRR